MYIVGFSRDLVIGPDLILLLTESFINSIKFQSFEIQYTDFLVQHVIQFLSVTPDVTSLTSVKWDTSFCLDFTLLYHDQDIFPRQSWDSHRACVVNLLVFQDSQASMASQLMPENICFCYVVQFYDCGGMGRVVPLTPIRAQNRNLFVYLLSFCFLCLSLQVLSYVFIYRMIFSSYF